MNKPDTVPSSDEMQTGPVFISYATSDRKEALSVCKAIERRGTKCWLACRDVEPGENYQEAIVAAIRKARAMVLVFSGAANNSDEIKKELSLASRHRVPLMALRIEEVEPSDAFAYELSTRQWLDAFGGWNEAIDALVRKVERASPPANSPEAAAATSSRRRTRLAPHSKRLCAALAVAFVALAAIAGMLLWKPMTGTEPLTVQIAGFQALGGTPADATGAFQQELRSAFGDERAVVVKDTDGTFTLGGSI